MDVRERLIAPFATVSHPGDIVSVDLAALILRLILFEKYIVQSVRLREFPHLVRSFGFPAVKELLTSDAITIRCEPLTIGQVGQFNLSEERVRKGILPFGSYSFATISVPDHREYIHKCLQPLHDIENMRLKDTIKLKQAITSNLLPPSATTADDMMRQFHADLRANTPVVKAAVAISLTEKMGRDVSVDEFLLSVHQIDEHDYRTETNISTLYGKNDEETHRIVEHGLCAVGGLNQRIAEMKEYQALSGFQNTDLPLFEEKLDFVTRLVSPDAQMERLRRVFLLKGFDDLNELIEKREVNLSKLLEIRHTTECREFRQWLSTIDSASDSELQDRISSVREKLSLVAYSKSGRAARWLVSAGIGSIPIIGPIAGAALGLLDTFLLDKVLPKTGPITFLNKLYPSVFKVS